MTRLYYAPGACSMAVHIVLEWVGRPYEAIRVDQHDPAFRAINPAGAVPALDHGTDRPLTQAAAILRLLATINPEADLLDERSPETEAELERWSSFLTGDLHPAFFPIFVPQRYTTDTGEGALEAVRSAARKLVSSRLDLLEAQLGDGDWIVGGKRTIIDAYATPMLRWASMMLEGGLGGHKALAAHLGRTLADPAVARVLAAEGLEAG